MGFSIHSALVADYLGVVERLFWPFGRVLVPVAVVERRTLQNVWTVSRNQKSGVPAFQF